jgi:shikimate dehydrogenase
MKAQARRVGLLGWPVAHSVSPAMQNAAFRALGLPWRYELVPTPPGALADTLASLEAQGFRGANVTVPHKETALGHLDRVDGLARSIGAVNTLSQCDGAWVGTNTDAAGFLETLRQTGFEPAGRRALVLGAGGAARAVVYALGQAGCTCLVHNRTAARARRLVYELARPTVVRPSDMVEASPTTGVLAAAGAAESAAAVGELSPLDLDGLDLLVNATSVGQWPRQASSPWPEIMPLLSHWTVFDLVYNPAETRLLARARAAGARSVGGLEMLVQQGALSFRLWTGLEAPLEIMRSAARRAVGSGDDDPWKTR